MPTSQVKISGFFLTIKETIFSTISDYNFPNIFCWKPRKDFKIWYTSYTLKKYIAEGYENSVLKHATFVALAVLCAARQKAVILREGFLDAVCRTDFKA